MTRREALPVILVPACNRMFGEHPFHVAGRKYVEAARLAGGLPLVVPGVPNDALDELLDLADGVLLTGSPTNVHPSRFNEEVLDASLPLDAVRDAWTLPLIPKILDRGIPLFAICRGFQEVNVALGGSLHQAVQTLPGYQDHRSRDEDPAERQYDFAHPIDVVVGGVLESIVGRPRFDVNSLHGQGVNRLAPGLRAEAHAPDGLIEAFAMPEARGFNLAVQWHPEWQAERNPISMQMLKAFGAACRRFQAEPGKRPLAFERDPEP